MIRPIEYGAKIAIVSPSSPVDDMGNIRKGLKALKKMGFNVSLGPNLTHLRTDGWSIASRDQRVDEIMDAFMDDSVDAILVSYGGYSSMEVLPYLDYEIIANHPKVFMGMSDVTTLNMAIMSKAGFKTFNGPNLRFRNKHSHEENNLEEAFSLLGQDSEWGAKPFSRSDRLPRTICGGMAKGRAIGGNLTLFTSLLGTPYLPDLSGSILFLEDTQSAGWELSICLNSMFLAGVFDIVEGVVLGEFTEQPDRSDGDLAVEDVLARFFRDMCPCVCGFPFSHGEYSAVIPLGTEVEVDADRREVYFGNPFGG